MSNAVAISVPQLEREMLQMPQADAPVIHRFGPGIYIREVLLPAGTLAIGHAQRFEHTNLMITGVVAMLGDDGAVTVLRAPLFFIGKPGRKVGYVIEDTVWQNIYATDERDIDKLEEMFLDKSSQWLDDNAAKIQADRLQNHWVRNDFLEVISTAGFSPEVVRRQSENTDDLVPMPPGFDGAVAVRPSTIEGMGVFASYPFEPGHAIGPASIDGKRTPLGRYVNHHPFPNAVVTKDEKGDVWAVAVRPISGCLGGSQGEEITFDYRQVLAMHGLWPNPGQGVTQ